MKKIIFILIIIGFSSAVAVWAAEQGEYNFLEKLPSFPNTPSPTDLSSYLQWVLTFGVSLAGIFAVLMIVVGGIQYVTAYGNQTQLDDAKNRINQALLGLLLAVAAWLILYTINPDLIKGTFNVPSISNPPPAKILISPM